MKWNEMKWKEINHVAFLIRWSAPVVLNVWGEKCAHDFPHYYVVSNS